jgi:2-methylisocitrate lyase-like PEP mutase family enzyme
MSLFENVEAVRHIASAVSIPVMADADTGYGNAVTVFHTVRYFEDAGIVGINIEDQVAPKRCGHFEGTEVISELEMARKIEAAAKGKREPNFIINARTDALAIEGIERAIQRAKTYVSAGADMIYPERVRNEDDVCRFVEEVAAPININMGFGIRSRPTTPLISIQRLEQLGVARVSLPRMLPAAAIRGMEMALGVLKGAIRSGEVVDRPDLLVGIEDIQNLIDYGDFRSLEAELLTTEQLSSKYAGAATSTPAPAKVRGD